MPVSGGPAAVWQQSRLAATAAANGAVQQPRAFGGDLQQLWHCCYRSKCLPALSRVISQPPCKAWALPRVLDIF